MSHETDPATPGPGPEHPDGEQRSRLKSRLAGGLSTLGPKTMPPVFTALMVVGVLDLLFMLLLPFGLHRGTESPWVQSERLGFLALSIATGLAFGLLAAITADRRGHNAWWFLAGHLGTFAAPFLAAMDLPESHPALARLLVAGLCAAGTIVSFRMTARPAREPVSYGPFMHRLSRIVFHSGNIWLGISLLIVLVLALIQGTRMEDAYGHKAAFATIYASWPFGLLYMLFAIALISATLRKYPWRVDQTGWLVVHSALILIIIGTFMTFWGKKEGVLALAEGESASSFELSTETRLQVLEADPQGRIRSMRPLWQRIADFDLNPTEIDPNRRYDVELPGTGVLPITVRHYYPRAKFRREFTNDGPREILAIMGTLIPPGRQTGQEFVIVEDDRRGPVPGLMTMQIHRVFDEESRRALFAGPAEERQIRLVVEDAEGEQVLAIPFSPPPLNRGGTDPRPVAGAGARIPGTEIDVEVTSWFDNYRNVSRKGIDASPGYPKNPAVEVRLKGPHGEARRTAFAWAPRSMAKLLGNDAYKDYVVRLDAWTIPPGSLWFVPEKDGTRFSYVYRSRSGGFRTGRVVPGKALDLGIPMRLRIDQVYTRLNMHDFWEFDGYREERPVVEITFGDEVELRGDSCWLPLGATSGEPLRWKGRTYVIRWVKSRWPLGFSLYLHDFHRDFYEGSTQPKTFESYLRLTDEHSENPRIRPSANIKIDMNHPLRYKGWRLYQSRFSSGGGEEVTFLQVNRDPGLLITYPACALLALGLVIVFFQKRFLRALSRYLRRRGVRPGTRVLASFGVVLLAFLACTPGAILIALLDEGPQLLFGVLTIAALLIAESVFFNTLVAAALDRKGSPRTSPSPAT